jgi:hypothetical protein
MGQSSTYANPIPFSAAAKAFLEAAGRAPDQSEHLRLGAVAAVLSTLPGVVPDNFPWDLFPDVRRP